MMSTDSQMWPLPVRHGSHRPQPMCPSPATRAPSADRVRYTVPYFVVAHEGNKIFTKRLFNLTFEFAPGASVATITQAPDDLTIHVENGKLPWNYQLISGFQLTPEQIAYNKKKARYAP